LALFDLLLEAVSIIGNLDRHFHGLFYTHLAKCKVQTSKSLQWLKQDGGKLTRPFLLRAKLATNLTFFLVPFS
jgi:hypothetical protein